MFSEWWEKDEERGFDPVDMGVKDANDAAANDRRGPRAVVAGASTLKAVGTGNGASAEADLALQRIS